MVLLAPAPNPWAAALERINLLGQDLLAAQRQLGLTTTQQAKQIGVTTTTLTGILTGVSNPTRTTIARCLRWLAAQH
ncbi:hypothetical protein GCM10009616_35930 [Microlunatus lacustris]